MEFLRGVVNGNIEPTLKDLQSVVIDVLAERDSWEAQFHSAATAASEYSEFWEKHQRDFDQFGNYIPHSQHDGDIRAVIEKCARIAENRAWMGKPYPGNDIAEAIRKLAKHGNMV